MLLGLKIASYNDIIYSYIMDSFNKVLSFVLGLIVVIVFLLVVTGRFNLRKSSKNLTSKTKLTLTPTNITGKYLTPTPLPVSFGRTTNDYKTKTSGKAPNTIPATGSPSVLLPLLISSLSLGIYLKRKNNF